VNTLLKTPLKSAIEAQGQGGLTNCSKFERGENSRKKSFFSAI